MVRYIPFIVISLVIFSSLGTLGYVGLKHNSLDDELSSVKSQYDHLEEKARLLQKNYSEQKARNSGLEQARRSLESEKATMETQLSHLQEKVSGLEVDSRAEIEKIEKDLSAKIEECQTQFAQLTVKYSQAVSELDQVSSALLVKKEEVERVQAEKDAIAFELDQSRETLVRYSGENAELVKITQELIEKYMNKSVSDVLAHKEPVTQLKKVELDNMLQSYQGRIEAHSLQ